MDACFGGPELGGQVQSVRMRTNPSSGPRVLTQRMLGTMMKFGAGTEIYGQGEPVEYVYEVVRGSVRTARFLSDGRRNIGGFYFAGNMFGLDDGNEHSLAAEAIEHSICRVVKRGTLIQMAANNRDLSNDLWNAAFHELARAQRHASMLVKNAHERVGSFLLDLEQHIAIGDLIDLPMSRQDIADYLGVTIETVSRVFTRMEQTLAIDLPSSRAVVLRNRSALAQN